MPFDREVPNVQPARGGRKRTSRANREREAFREGYGAHSKHKQHFRKEDLRSVIHWSIVILVLIAVVTIGGMLATWGWHTLAPQHYHWLSPEELTQIKSLLFSAAMAAFVSEYARKMLADISN